MGAIKCQTIAGFIEEKFPKKLAESWDNVGLLVGDGSKVVKKLMICLDVTEWVIEEAIEQKVDLIVAHHPVIFGSIKRITADTVLGRKLLKLITNNIAVYCAHTNYDIGKGGLNELFAEQLGFRKNESKLIETTFTDKLLKVIIYIPKGHEKKVFDAVMAAGAGHIGNYSSCSFKTEGIGTFIPEADTNPFIGQPGEFEEVEEVKLGTIVPQSLLNKVIKALIKAHPYEEPAYDIMPLENQGETMGIGRVAELEHETTLAAYAQNVKAALGIEHVKIAGDPNKKVKKVAMLNGTGNKFISAARFAGADVLVTGDMQYHELIDAVEAGLSIIDAGHYPTECIMITAMTAYLKEKCLAGNYSVDIIQAESNKEISIII